MICLSLAGKEFAISKSKNLLYVLAGWEFSSLIMTYYYFNNSKYIYIYIWTWKKPMYERETSVCKCWVGTTAKKTPKKQEVYILHQKEIFVLYQKGIALSIWKDPIDSASVKLHIIHKTLLLEIPCINKPKLMIKGNTNVIMPLTKHSF